MLDGFTLTESHARGGEYSWRLKESEIRYRGSRQFAELVQQRIPAHADRIAAFRDALDLLDVWSWRADYRSEDAGYATLDGSHWTFTASVGSRKCKCGGENGYPSFADVQQTTLGHGRFALLLAALYACFDIETFIHIANHQRQRGVKEDE